MLTTTPPMRKINARKKPYKGVSFFAGCGGSSTGHKMAGIDIMYANEFIPAARKTYRLNHPTALVDGRDVRKVKGQQILDRLGLKVGELDLMDMSPPCKSFSTAGTKDKGWGEVSHYSDGVHQRTDDLFFEAARLVTELKPKVFVAENVAGLAQGNAKGYFLEILKSLEDCGYKVSARVLNAAYLGVPQARERIIFVGVRNDLVKMGFKPVHPDPLPDVTTVREKLPHIRMLKSKKRGMLAYVPSDIPSPTIVASDGTNSETAGFSSGGFIEDKTGERRKYNLKELREVFSFPQDFQLYGNFKQKWERLGRSVPPLMMYHVTRRIISDILKPYYELRATGKAKIKLGPGLKQITTDANVKKAKKKTGESKIKAELADLKKTVRKASKKLAKNTGMDVAEFSKQLKKLGKERTDKAIKTDAKKLIAKGIRKGVEAAVREAKAVKTHRGRN